MSEPTKRQLPRFSLKSLLAVLTIASIAFGYVTWRRHSILRDCDTLKADGVQFTLPDTWIDQVWQRYPDEFVVPVEIVTTKDGTERFVRSRDLLQQMGAANVRMLAPVMAWPK